MKTLDTKKDFIEALADYSDNDQMVINVHEGPIHEDNYQITLDPIHMGLDKNGKDRGYQLHLCPVVVNNNADQDKKPFVVGNDYLYSELEKLSESYEWNEYGRFTIGKSIVHVEDDKERCAAFILTSHNTNGGYYKCVYSEF